MRGLQQLETFGDDPDHDEDPDILQEFLLQRDSGNLHDQLPWRGFEVSSE